MVNEPNPFAVGEFVRSTPTLLLVITTSSPACGTALSLQFELTNQSFVPLVVIHVLVAAEVDKGCTSARIAEDRTAQPTAILVVLIGMPPVVYHFPTLLILFQSLKKYIFFSPLFLYIPACPL
jgi:hypothetical protein